jgi:cell pole-organizing protein PopZ
MTQPAKSQEPSMEEILASIRRIIADDEGEQPAGLSTTPAAFQPESFAPPVPPVLKPVAVAPAPKPATPVELLQDIPPTSSRPVAAPPVSVAPSPIVEEATADILDLTDEMRVPEQPAPIPFRTIEAQPDVIFAEPRPVASAMKEETVQASIADRFSEVRPTPAASAENPLMSNSTSAAVDSAFSTLAHTVLSNNARTLDDLVKDMLRPMLKSWLDDNLPSLVERLVRAEIERVSRGR